MSRTIELDGKQVTVYTEDDLKAQVEQATAGLVPKETIDDIKNRAAASARKESEAKLAALQEQMKHLQDDDPAKELSARLSTIQQQLDEERKSRQAAERQAAISRVVTTLQGQRLHKGATKLAERMAAEYLTEGSSLTENSITDIAARMKKDFPVLFDTQTPKGGLPGQGERTDAEPSMNDLIRGRAASTTDE